MSDAVDVRVIKREFQFFVRSRLDPGVHGTLIVTVHWMGWRHRVMQAALWMLRKAGHDVVEP